MSVLNILAYVGIALGSAFAMWILNLLLGRKKIRYVFGETVVSGKEGNSTATFLLALLELFGLSIWMLLKLFNLSVLKSVGISAILSIVTYFTLLIVLYFIYKPKTGDIQIDKAEDIATVINCIINGIILAVMLAKLGLF